MDKCRWLSEVYESSVVRVVMDLRGGAQVAALIFLLPLLDSIPRGDVYGGSVSSGRFIPSDNDNCTVTQKQ
jgi:hypothetical protein